MTGAGVVMTGTAVFTTGAAVVTVGAGVAKMGVGRPGSAEIGVEMEGEIEHQQMSLVSSAAGKNF